MRRRGRAVTGLVGGVPTANLKRLTATANRSILAAHERPLLVDLVRLDRTVPAAAAPDRAWRFSRDSAHSASMDGLFSYALWALISLIVIGSGIAVLVW
jgi:hypothetical protein